jgi:hypothetical protein
MTADDGGIDRRSLLLEIKRTLNRSELSDACFFLKIDPEDLTQGGRSYLARELVLYCERHGRMNDLHQYLQNLHTRRCMPASSLRKCPGMAPTSLMERPPFLCAK